MTAAEAIREADADAEIVIVGADRHGYYSRPGLAYYLTREMPEQRLFPFAPRTSSAWTSRYSPGAPSASTPPPTG